MNIKMESTRTESTSVLSISVTPEKETKKWRLRMLILMGACTILALSIGVLVPLYAFGGCSSDKDVTPLPTTSGTHQTSTTTGTPNERQRTVSTNYGPIVGHEVDVGGHGLLHETVISYLGVPYAKPPVGPLRWKKPVPPETWKEPLIADTLPNMCHQPPLVIRGTHGGWDRFHEDCLYMQIYTPKDTSKGLYPVMFYIHGGGFRTGGSIQYTGHYYAIRDVIMVAINYRLGILGFASTDDPATDSNYGLWDMIAALTYVKGNIRAFGGDPDKITIFGMSAGAVSVGLFLISPLTKGMYSQAILQSGTELGTEPFAEPNDGREISFIHLADKLGCARTTNAEIMECMRQIDVELILNTEVNCTGCRGNEIIVDGPEGIMPKMPLLLRQEGLGHNVKVLAGTNMNEDSFSVLAMCPQCLLRGMTEAEFHHHIQHLIMQRSDGFTRDTAVEDIYRATLLTYTPWPYTQDGTLNKKRLADIISDMTFNVPTNVMLNYQCNIAECFQYVFNVRMMLQSGNGLLPEWMGVPHGMELPFVFGWPLLQTAPLEVRKDTGNLTMPLGVTFADNDRKWTNFTIDLWTNFAKYRNPTPVPVTPPEHSRPVTWYNQSIDRKWYLHIDNEFPDKNPTKIKLNYRPLETAFVFNYKPTLAMGHGLHHDFVGKTHSIALEEIISSSLFKELIKKN